jgi:hypothetical protein
MPGADVAVSGKSVEGISRNADFFGGRKVLGNLRESDLFGAGQALDVFRHVRS